MKAQPKGWAFAFRHRIRRSEISVCLCAEALYFYANVLLKGLTLVYWLVAISIRSSHFSASTDLLPL